MQARRHVTLCDPKDEKFVSNQVKREWNAADIKRLALLGELISLPYQPIGAGKRHDELIYINLSNSSPEKRKKKRKKNLPLRACMYA